MAVQFNQFLRFRSPVPVLRQTALEECGLVCLAMLASFYGYHADVTQLRTLFGLLGTRLQDLLDNARKLKLDARALRLELEELPRLRLPAILHWDMDHFVVLVKARSKRALIHDPAAGARWYTWTELSHHFTGVAVECQPASDFEVRQDKRKLRLVDLWQRSRGIAVFVLQLCLLSLLLQALTLAGPFYTQLVVDEGLQRRDHDLITLLALGFGVFLLVQALIEGARAWVAQHVGHRLSFQLNSNLFFHLFRLPLHWYERRSTGDITSRISSLDPIHGMLTEGFIMFIIDGLMAVSTLALMLWYAVDLTLIVVAAVVLFGVIKAIVYPKIRQCSEDEILAAADQETMVIETLRNISAIKVFGREVQRHRHWQNGYSKVLKASYQQGTLGIITNLADTLLFGLENIILVYLAALSIIASEMSIGMLFAFMSYKSQFSGRMTALIGRLLELRILRLHLDRLSDVCFETPEISTEQKAVRAPMQGALHMTAETVGYEGYEPVLRQIDLHVKPHQSILIAGASGSGKTTLMKAMMSLLPVEGDIRVDGMPLATYGIEHYRSGIAAVMQNDSLLVGSITENVTFFDPQPDKSRVATCIETVGMTAECECLPMGLHTQVGDLGSLLSSGQTQRLLLARALYAEPTILFLDEAMAHLDQELANQITQRLLAWPATKVIIDHRPTMACLVDAAFLLEAGQLKPLQVAP